MKPEIEQFIIPATSKNLPNSPREIAALEALVGPLPPSLRRLMERHGSFAFSEPAFVTETLAGDLPLFVFYSATSPYGIPEDLDTFDELKSHNLIPFADDIFNDRYAYSKEDHSVWFLDVTYDLGLQKISSTVELFLSSIEIREDK